MLDVFRSERFEVDVLNVIKWADMPGERSDFNNQFSEISDDELRISEFDVLLRPI